MYVLGIVGCGAHDSSACLIKDGQIIAAIEEERFSRIKKDNGFPSYSIGFCLKEAGITIDQVSHVGYNFNTKAKSKEMLWHIIRYFPRSLALINKRSIGVVRGQRNIEKLFRQKFNYHGPFYLIDHHLAHAASAFLVSPFEHAAILSVDGIGEWTTTWLGWGKGNEIKIIKEIEFPHSLGLVYGAITQYLGFKIFFDEYKVMGLAAYGNNNYKNNFAQMIKLEPEGSYKVDISYFNYHLGLEKNRVSQKFIDTFGPIRKEGSPILDCHKDIAAAIQHRLEEVILYLADYLKRVTGEDNLCLAGGVGLNCVANGKLAASKKFKNIFIQPAAHDAGTALGVSYYIYNSLLGNERNFVMDHVYYGPEYTERETEQVLREAGDSISYSYCQDIARKGAELIASGKVIGWFQGRSEFGPRALGNRSILADPRRPEMKDIINAKIKFREPFRPFAPSILEEYARRYFDLSGSSPFMILAFNVLPEKKALIPAVTHVDNTARVHTVNKRTNPLFYRLILEFAKITDVPVVLNTSFNRAGEPIVNSPKDALNCFLGSDLDYLLISNFLVKKLAWSDS